MGPDYAHAEARKSPALDGKVERDSSGKEVRYPVILSNREKLIARKVCMAFKQVLFKPLVPYLSEYANSLTNTGEMILKHKLFL